MIDLEELKEELANTLDPDDVVVLLEIETPELLEMFEHKLIEHIDKFTCYDISEIDNDTTEESSDEEVI